MAVADVKEALTNLVTAVNGAIDQWLADLATLAADEPQNFPVFPVFPLKDLEDLSGEVNDDILSFFAGHDAAAKAAADAEVDRETNSETDAASRKAAAAARKQDLIDKKGHGKPA